MYRVILSWNGEPVLHAYSFMLSISFILATLLAVREADRRGFWLAPEFGVVALVGALIGAKVFHILQFGNRMWPGENPVWHLWRALKIWEPGLVFYGGLIGGIAAVALYAWFQRIPHLKAADIISPYLLLGEAITRIGCYMNGCCWGAPTTLAWGVVYPYGSRAYRMQLEQGILQPGSMCPVAVHPSPLYMTLLLLIAFAFLKWWVLPRRCFSGESALFYGLTYGLVRFAVESTRGDSLYSTLGMTVSQAISAGMVLLSLLLLIYGAYRHGGLWSSHPDALDRQDIKKRSGTVIAQKD